MTEEPRTTNETRVVDNPAAHRYEIYVGDALAGFALYRLRSDRPDEIVVVHSEIADAFEHHGLGSHLAASVLDDIRARGLRVVPTCPFFARYIHEHPEYRDLVA